MRANIVAVRAKLETVRLVTIAAGDTGVEHLALGEGTVLVVLLLYLPVGEVVVFIEQRDAVVVAHRLPVDVIFVNLAAPRVASRTHLDFLLRCARRASASVTGREIDRPCDAFALVKRNRQTLGRVELLPLALLLRPREVI